MPVSASQVSTPKSHSAPPHRYHVSFMQMGSPREQPAGSYRALDQAIQRGDELRSTKRVTMVQITDRGQTSWSYVGGRGVAIPRSQTLHRYVCGQRDKDQDWPTL